MVSATQTAVSFSNEEIKRYSRHLIMPEIGLEGQRKLKSASVLIIGAGGLGSPLALYLAAAGVGRMGIVDFDVVDSTNLQRQILHSEAFLGKSKLESARERLHGINPHIHIETYETAFSTENAAALVQAYDIIADGTDNFPTRYLVNDACVFYKKPNIYGSIFRFEGQASVFDARRGPCYRCLFPQPPPANEVPDCAEGGVLGVLPGIIGSIQALEAIKLITGQGEPLIGRLLLFDALKMNFSELKLGKNPGCPVCGMSPTIHKFIDYVQFCGGSPTTDADRKAAISAGELHERLKSAKPPLLLDVREPHEYAICQLENSLEIPMKQLTGSLNKISMSQDIVIYCRSGVRSRKALKLLRDAGFTRVQQLKGGLLAWAKEVDPTMPTY